MSRRFVIGDFIQYPHEIPDQSDVDITGRTLKKNQCVFMSAVRNIPCTCFIHVCVLSWKRLGCKLLPTPPFLSDMLEQVKVTIAWNVASCKKTRLAWWRDLSCATACILENGADWLWRIARKVSVRAGRGGRGETRAVNRPSQVWPER